MDGCIFCKIVEGEIPCYKVYEDDGFFGFLDIKSLNKGNCLLIPKKHFRWVDDVEDFGAYWEAARKISTATKKALGSITTSYLTLGFEVPHAHIRIVPRFKNDGHDDGIQISNVKDFSKEEMTEIAEKIRSNLNS